LGQDTNNGSPVNQRRHVGEDLHGNANSMGSSLVQLEAPMRLGDCTAVTEFERHASEYSDLLSDPICDSSSTDFFFSHRRKWDLLATELKRRGFREGRSSWLDVGCHNGELLSLGRSFFGRAVGCDPSANTIGGKSDIAFQSDPCKLPFPEGSFDLVTAVCAYHHVPIEKRQILAADILRVLRPGGTACFMEPNPLNPVTRRIVSRVNASARLASHWEMTSLVRSVGLRKPASRFFLYLPERMYAHLPGIESLLENVPLGGQYALFCERPDRSQSVKSGIRMAFGAGMPVPVAL
jgi:SAM-dependent methyltransferase